ncbi:MAG: efflux RND transporter periplasmic adaptor subunit [Verrucomicrobia bacterium]|nr:MAG: efflux RND transporter periplasmic adaptor subunit [Verrucomicrobiota bacterium]
MNPTPSPTPEPPPPARQIHFGRWTLLAAVIVAAAWYAGAAPRWRARDAAVDRSQRAGPTFVLVTRASSTNVAEPPVFPAEIKAWTEAQILPRATGYVRRWNAELGSRVKAGDLLAEIDAPEIEQELTKARADLAHAEAATALARTTATRWQELLKTAGVSEQETAEKTADLALRKAAEESARATVRRFEQLVGFTRVTAPFDGTITVRHVDVGELVSAGSTREMFHLADTARVRVFVHLPQALAATLDTNQAAELIPGESGTRRIPVRVARTAGQLEASTRTLLVEFDLDNPRGEFLAGGFTRVRFPESRTEPVLTVPANALIFHADGPQVAVVRDDNRVELRRVTLGRDLGPVVQIRAGISGTERIVLNPADSLHDGQSVQIRETATSSAAKP